MSNGVNPIIFTVYTDGLLTRLQKTNVGCHTVDHYSGELSYADDHTVVSPVDKTPVQRPLVLSAFSISLYV